MEHVCIQKETWIETFGSLLHSTEENTNQTQHEGWLGKTSTVDLYPHKISSRAIQQIALLHFPTYCTVNHFRNEYTATCNFRICNTPTIFVTRTLVYIFHMVNTVF